MQVDFYFSFRSPYSYLAAAQAEALVAEWELDFVVRVVRPIAVRVPGFFQTVNPLWPPYLFRDTTRIAERLGLPYRWPSPDPIVQDRSTGEISDDQPHIGRLSRAGVLAAERGKGLAYVRSVSRAIWSGTINDWHLGDHLALAAAEAGLDGAELERTAASEQARLDAQLIANEIAQAESGHWGVPLFLFEGEPFFGQDRLPDLVWRMQQRGLVARE